MSQPQELRCHSCSKFVGHADAPMRVVCLFKPSLMGRVPRSNTLEVRKRCTSCTWVNVFHPARLAMPATAVIETKA